MYYLKLCCTIGALSGTGVVWQGIFRKEGKLSVFVTVYETERLRNVIVIV